MNRIANRNARFNCDAAAAVCGAVIFIFLFITAARGFGLPDESFYYTIPQRLLHGDRLFTEEWNYTQLAFVFDVFPYWLYTKLTGGTEGLILCMRYFFLCCDLLFYIYACRKLRRFGPAGIVSAVLFCAVIPQTICALSYHTVSSFAALHFWLLLLPEANRAPARAKVFLAGLVFACGVLAEPFLLFAFAAYAVSAAVFFMKSKKNPTGENPFTFLLERRTFLFVLFGAISAFAAFMIWFAASGSLAALPKMLPYLLKDRDFNSSNIIDLSKLGSALKLYGVVPSALLLASVFAAGSFRLKKDKSEGFRRGVFAVVTLSAAACYVWAFFIKLLPSPHNFLIPFLQYHGLPALFWSSGLVMLRSKKDPVITSVLAVGWLYTLCVDVASANVFGSGGRLAQIAGIVSFFALINEFRNTKRSPAVPQRTKTKKSACKTAQSAFCGCSRRDRLHAAVANGVPFDPGTVPCAGKGIPEGAGYKADTSRAAYTNVQVFEKERAGRGELLPAFTFSLR